MSVELPKDAEGREIPLDTTAMYGADGKVVNISRWVYCTALGFLDDFLRGWYAMGSGDRLVSTVSLHLTPPDSWEKLEEGCGLAELRSLRLFWQECVRLLIVHRRQRRNLRKGCHARHRIPHPQAEG